MTPSPSPSAAPSATPSPAPGPPPAPTAVPPSSVLINEVAWAGTLASSADEWIELYNPGPAPIDLQGWTLTDGGDIKITLQGVIAAHGFFLLERTDDSTIADLGADQIYTGSLNNKGESLFLRDPSGSLVDSANASGGPWPAGDQSTRASMERLGQEDRPTSWGTFSGYHGIGRDAKGNPIQGTPRGANSLLLPVPTASPTAHPSPAPTPLPPGALLINEVAWAGTLASSSDEWIEIYNPGPTPIDLQGWTLSDGGDIQISLQGTIPAHGFFLLERTDDTTIADIPADQIYSGALANAGESLSLRDPSGNPIDRANPGGGAWPAGHAPSRASMERAGGGDAPSSWGTFNGHHGSGHDAEGNPIQGTPKATNSLLYPPPPPLWIKGKVVINEVLIRPHYDWEGKGGVNTGDEFIELLNLGPLPVFLKGWILDDLAGAGSKPYVLPGITLQPGSFVALFRSRTHIALNDSGDTVRLLSPDGRLQDQITYLRVRAYNLSYGRLPDGSGHLTYGLWPTPNQPNLLFEEPLPEPPPQPLPCPHNGAARPLLLRQARHPAAVRRLRRLGLDPCAGQD